MPDISVVVDGVKFPNPFVIASGPPGTNEQAISKAFDEGWGGMIAKTVCLDSEKIINVAPRYAKLKSRVHGEIIGFQNIELISDRPLEEWEREFVSLKKKYPNQVLFASLMEEYDEGRWRELVQRCEATGVDGFELNFSCPHGLPERKMGAAMGQDPQIVEDVCRWVRKATNKPVWAKMTPNITHISEPAAAAIRGGASGISAINTILSVTGIDLKKLRPMPTVEGYSIPGGYSCQAVRPIALRMVMELGRDLKGTNISGMGGVECGEDAIQFILMGASTVQVCTAAMLQGYGMVKELCSTLDAFMTEHGFTSIDEFRGHALQYFTTHADLVKRQKEARLERAGKNRRDEEWGRDNITSKTNELTANEGGGVVARTAAVGANGR